jgi:hypothetical protein
MESVFCFEGTIGFPLGRKSKIFFVDGFVGVGLVDYPFAIQVMVVF